VQPHFFTLYIKQLKDGLVPVIFALCNASLQSGVFNEDQKRANVRTRLKKPILHAHNLTDNLTAYWPISSLSFLSEVIERIAAGQFMCLPHVSTPGFQVSILFSLMLTLSADYQ
jgi:hypothetical protein